MPSEIEAETLADLCADAEAIPSAAFSRAVRVTGAPAQPVARDMDAVIAALMSHRRRLDDPDATYEF
jgi:hypothetical protein